MAPCRRPLHDHPLAVVSSTNSVKRAFDLVVATMMLILLSPVILAIAVLVRLRLGRPVLFRQVRPGLGGGAFTIYKFRSMLDGTDEHGVTLPNSERRHPFGERLRALSLDELPELWNVIKGDMSLVGPRPLRMFYLERYNAEQARRHEVKPGITGVAQVGGRNAITWEEKFALDVDYVDNHDLALDIAILFRTLGTVVSRDDVVPHGRTEMPDFMGTPPDDIQPGHQS